MYLVDLLGCVSVKQVPSLEEDIVVIPENLFSWCDQPMVVSRKDWEELYVNYRGKEPDIEPVFAAIMSVSKL